MIFHSCSSISALLYVLASLKSNTRLSPFIPVRRSFIPPSTLEVSVLTTATNRCVKHLSNTIKSRCSWTPQFVKLDVRETRCSWTSQFVYLDVREPRCSGLQHFYNKTTLGNTNLSCAGFYDSRWHHVDGESACHTLLLLRRALSANTVLYFIE